MLARAARYVLAALALVAATYSFIFARAAILFDRDTADSVPAAVALVPYNSDYVARLAAWEPRNQNALLHRAIELNPFAYGTYLQLGLIAELQHHNPAVAEHYYLDAARVDKMFLPKWTLTNFYFRQQEEDKFLQWARATLEITPYSPDPVFTQMWLMSQDAPKLAATVPNRPGILLAYADFLANAAQFNAIPPVIERLTSLVPGRNAAAFGRDDQVEPMEDRLLLAGQFRAALGIWTTLHRANWIGLPAPSPQSPVTNGDFAVPFLHHGFDWKPASLAGVTVEQSPEDKSVRIVLNGEEPEHCVLLEQYVPLDLAHDYRLTWRAESPDGQLPAGLSWHLHPVEGSPLAELASPDLSSAKDWTFKSPASADLYALSLEYSRPMGSTLSNGALILRSVRMEQLQP